MPYLKKESVSAVVDQTLEDVIDTDEALTADSDSLVPSQQAVKAYVDNSTPASLIHQATVTLTDAQIKALPTTGVEVVPEPGEDKLLRLMGGVYRFTRVADYTNIDGTFSGMFVRYGGSTCLASLYNPVAGFLDFGAPLGDFAIALINNKFNVVSGVGVEEPPWDSADALDEPFVVAIDNGATGNLTGGDAGNSLEVSIFYTIYDVNTNEFV